MDSEENQSLQTGTKTKNKSLDSRPCILHLYDEELKKILHDLTIVNSGLNEGSESQEATTIDRSKDLKVSSTLTCNSCNVTFSNTQEQRQHYKSDWHRYNLKQKIKGAASVSAQAFFNIKDNPTSSLTSSNPNSPKSSRSSLNKRPPPKAIPAHVLGNRNFSDQSESSSSDSESDWSSFEDDANDNVRDPKIYFKNGEKKILSLHRCVLYGKRNLPSHDGEIIRMICTIQERLMWSILLVGGGRFAAAIFNGKNTLCHKTFRRYTIRAKQGTTQATKDNKQNGPYHQGSAGASLRRHNELALVQDIQNLLELWSDDLKKCHCIFYRASGPNKTILFGGKSPTLKKGDPRLRPIPLPTGRATFQEIQRIHDILSSVECFCDASDITSLPHESPKKTNIKKIFKGRKSQKAAMPQVLQKSIAKQGPPSGRFFDSESSESETPLYLVEEDEILNLVNLKMFEGTRKPKRRAEKSFQNISTKSSSANNL